MPSEGLGSAEEAANKAAETREHLKRLLAVEEVVLSAELAELLRHRELMWNLIPPLSRKLTLPFLTLKETLRLDSAVTEKGDEKNPGDRDHLVKAYKGLQSAAFDQWVFKDTNDFEGLRWARKRNIDLQNLKLEYKGITGRNEVLYKLVFDRNEDIATYYAIRSRATDFFDANDIKIFCTTLHLASYYGYLKVVECLNERCRNPSHQIVDEEDDTPLSLASSRGHAGVVRALLAAGVNANNENDEDINHGSPLHLASANGHLEVVEALLAAKADVNKGVDYVGEGVSFSFPIVSASERGYLEVVRALLAAGADVNNVSGYNDDTAFGTALHAASENGHLGVVEALLTANADVNMVNDDDWFTPLHLASKEGHLGVVRALLAAGADARQRAFAHGPTPLRLALRNKHTEVAALLRESGALHSES